MQGDEVMAFLLHVGDFVDVGFVGGADVSRLHGDGVDGADEFAGGDLEADFCADAFDDLECAAHALVVVDGGAVAAVPAVGEQLIVHALADGVAAVALDAKDARGEDVFARDVDPGENPLERREVGAAFEAVEVRDEFGEFGKLGRGFVMFGEEGHWFKFPNF